MKDIIMIISGLVAGLVIWLFKELISGQIKATKAGEPFDAKKLVNGITSVVRSDLWGKSISQELSIRTWLIRIGIFGVIAGCIYGWGWYKGTQGLQPILDWHGKEEWVSLNEHYLHVCKDGTMEVVDTDKKTVLKKITVKDLANLKKNLKPYGVILEPIAVVGGSTGIKAGFEAGAGISWLKWYKYNADAFLTNLGGYPVAVSYKITDNSGAGVGIGYGYKGDKRIIGYYKFKF
jgi:hypothetical protein